MTKLTVGADWLVCLFSVPYHRPQGGGHIARQIRSRATPCLLLTQTTKQKLNLYSIRYYLLARKYIQYYTYQGDFYYKGKIYTYQDCWKKSVKGLLG